MDRSVPLIAIIELCNQMAAPPCGDAFCEAVTYGNNLTPCASLPWCRKNQKVLYAADALIGDIRRQTVHQCDDVSQVWRSRDGGVNVWTEHIV